MHGDIYIITCGFTGHLNEKDEEESDSSSIDMEDEGRNGESDGDGNSSDVPNLSETERSII